jgi:hypothetical protein
VAGIKEIDNITVTDNNARIVLRAIAAHTEAARSQLRNDDGTIRALARCAAKARDFSKSEIAPTVDEPEHVPYPSCF